MKMKWVLNVKIHRKGSRDQSVKMDFKRTTDIQVVQNTNHITFDDLTIHPTRNRFIDIDFCISFFGLNSYLDWYNKVI
jgi:hypothetical protein